MQKQTKTYAKDVTPNKPPLKDCLGKLYTLNWSENFEQFLKELGVKKSVRIQAVNSKPKVTLKKQNDEYILITSYPEIKDVTVRFKPGRTVERRRPGGVVATSVFHIIDNKVIEEQQLDGLNVVIERVFTRKDLTITMEVNDVKCRRGYTVSTSKHSIGTETSRRSSLWKTSTSNEPELVQEFESALESITMRESQTESEDVCF